MLNQSMGRVPARSLAEDWVTPIYTTTTKKNVDHRNPKNMVYHFGVGRGRPNTLGESGKRQKREGEPPHEVFVLA